MLAALLVILWHGDREIDALDFVLSEFHLGATYHAVIQRRLWRRLPVDVLVVPLVIVVVTYALWLSGQASLADYRSPCMPPSGIEAGRALASAAFISAPSAARFRACMNACSAAPSICRWRRARLPTLIWPRQNMKDNPIFA